MIVHKCVTQEVQWIDGWDISTQSDILTSGKDIICLNIDVLRVVLLLSWFIDPIVMEGRITVIIHGDGVILWYYYGLVQGILVIYKDPVGKFVTKMFDF